MQITSIRDLAGRLNNLCSLCNALSNTSYEATSSFAIVLPELSALVDAVRDAIVSGSEPPSPDWQATAPMTPDEATELVRHLHNDPLGYLRSEVSEATKAAIHKQLIEKMNEVRAAFDKAPALPKRPEWLPGIDPFQQYALNDVPAPIGDIPDDDKFAFNLDEAVDHENERGDQ